MIKGDKIINSYFSTHKWKELNIGDNDLSTMFLHRQYTEIEMAPVGYNGANRYIINGPFYFELLEDGIEEDWKTRQVQKIKDIPKGTKLLCKSILYNFYGTYLEAEYNNRTYSLNPRICKYINSLYTADA